jgi:type VI secretion system secreted protein VgrG
VCGGFEYQIDCVATSCRLPLKEFIGLPATLEFVTDRGRLRQVSGVIAQASSGESDGAISSYRIMLSDVMEIMDQRINTRVFRRLSWPQIVVVVLNEWLQIHGAQAAAFDYEFADGFRLENYPEREQTIQFNESDAAFVRRLLGRSGIAWFFRPGSSRVLQQSGQVSESAPAHTLVLFDAHSSLSRNDAGVVRYHRDDATEERDSITRWGAVRKFQAGNASVFSWDYKQPGNLPVMVTEVPGKIDQGRSGNSLAGAVQEYIVESPHVATDSDQLYRLGLLRMQRKELDSKCFTGEGTVRDFRVGEYFTITNHPEIDRHPVAERDFVITALDVRARNNLPRSLEERVQRLFACNGWEAKQGESAQEWSASPFEMRFEAVRRAIPIVPAFDPRIDLRDPGLQIALVVGGQNEVVHCDEYGRVKIRFPATRPADHEHAGGAGASETDADSAWVRVASQWAGTEDSHCGNLTLPRVGTEVLVAFIGGDPDKPIIISQLYNARALPPPLSKNANLPTTRFLSGMRSQEIHGWRANQLRFDDTPREISAQLASDDGASQLNLGWLTHPRGERRQPRGEGAELRSDHAVAIRGGKGVLITADGSAKAEGNQLERAELIGLADGLRDIADQLAKLAQIHAKDSDNGPLLSELVDKLRHLDHGTNVVEGGTGGAPIVAISGPAGIVMASTESIALGAQKNIELIASADMHLAAGGRTSVRAAMGLSAFTNDGGIKHVAAHGDVQSEAQDGTINLIAKKVMELISNTDWINIKARKGVRIYGGGSELKISAEGIVGNTTGNSHMYAADHQTFAKRASEVEFPDELPHHDICIPCMLVAARAHSPLVEAQ